MNEITLIRRKTDRPKNSHYQCHEIFSQFLRIEPPGPLINRLTWFCWKIRFRGYILNFGLCWNSSHIYLFKFNILYQGKNKIYAGKTPRSVSLRRVRFRAVLVIFGFSNFFKEINMWALVSQRYSVKKNCLPPRKRIFQQNHFSHFRGPCGLVS